MGTRNIIYILLTVFAVSAFRFSVSAQVIRVGLKGGIQSSWVKYDDSAMLDTVSVNPLIGFAAGAAIAFKVKNRYFLHTEIIYSTKGKVLKGKIDPDFKDRVIYQFIEVPVLYSMHFKGSVGDKKFKWYAGAGPCISYWLGGKGTVNSGDISEYLDPIKYKLKFGVREDHSRADIVYINNAKRLQFGLNVGLGMVLEPITNHKVMLDLRYELTHTRMGKRIGHDYLLPADFDDNMKSRNSTLRISLLYLLEYNLDPKERNKGKSTIELKGKGR
jgi:hypothetical protein